MFITINRAIERVNSALDASAFIPVVFVALIGLFMAADWTLENTSAPVAATPSVSTEG
jgi:hypothetical protein